MKKLILFLSSVITTAGILAQTPQGISHQAVMRDAKYNLIVNSPIGLQVSILQGADDGDAVYVETHEVTTNQNGLITYIIGQGDVVKGKFEEIDWADGPYWLETKADPKGGTNYSITGVTQFLSVPYAMYSNDSAELFELIKDIQNELNLLKKLAGVGTVEDIDGNRYRTIKIGNQIWMAENLRVTRDASGNSITRYCFNNNTTNCNLYGGLYTWHTVMNGQSSSDSNPSSVQGICPTGWHVPSDAEWTELVNYVVSQGYPNSNVVGGAGNALKSCRQVGSPLGGECDTSEHPRWNSHGTHSGFDEFGFSALPGGYRWTTGSFSHLGTLGFWWSATEHSSSNAWLRRMYHGIGDVDRFGSNETNGFSLRCVRNL